MKLSTVFLCVSVTLALILHQTESTAEDQWCGRTTNGALCLSIVQPDPRAFLKTSPEGLCTILRDNALATAGATYFKISKLLKRPNEPHLSSSLHECLTGYRSAIASLKSADCGVINQQTYLGLVGAFSDAGDVPRDCELSFQEPPAIASPIYPENQRLRQTCGIILELVNLVECNHPSFC